MPDLPALLVPILTFNVVGITGNLTSCQIYLEVDSQVFGYVLLHRGKVRSILQSISSI